MLRPLIIEFICAFYHVTSRGNERNVIFYSDEYVKKCQKMGSGLTIIHFELTSVVKCTMISAVGWATSFRCPTLLCGDAK
jgi:hypothetical protein